MTKIIRILHSPNTHEDLARHSFFGQGLEGFTVLVSSLGDGASPPQYDRSPITVLLDWKESDARRLADQFFWSMIEVEVDDVRFMEIEKRLQSTAKPLVPYTQPLGN